MKEQYKIDEAKFFLERMEGSIGDRIAFRYNLSAFLSAARSVLQYALTESAGKSNQKWYDDKVKQTNEALSNILEDFKEKRDANIHRGEPVDPARDVTVAISGGVMAIAAAGEVFFNDEPIEMSRPKEETPPPESTEGKPDIAVRYRFNDWSGPEDIIVLSHRYIEVLEHFVQDGIAKGILTGKVSSGATISPSDFPSPFSGNKDGATSGRRNGRRHYGGKKGATPNKDAAL